VPAGVTCHVVPRSPDRLARGAALGAGLDAATARVVPDEAQRKANRERSAGLRDFVRQEVWAKLP